MVEERKTYTEVSAELDISPRAIEVFWKIARTSILYPLHVVSLRRMNREALLAVDLPDFFILTSGCPKLSQIVDTLKRCRVQTLRELTTTPDLYGRCRKAIEEELRKPLQGPVRLSALLSEVSARTASTMRVLETFVRDCGLELMQG